MICCQTKRIKNEKIQPTKLLNSIHQCLEDFGIINDESASTHQTPNCQNVQITFHYPTDFPITRTLSNAMKTSKSVEKLINDIHLISIRKTSFFVFKNGTTNQYTKFLSNKNGFTLLVTESK